MSVNQPNDDTLMTTGEVASIMGVTSETVRDWIAGGRLSAVRLPSGRYRVKRGVLTAFANHSFSTPTVEVDDGGSIV